MNRLAVLALLAGCTTHKIVVFGGEVHAHLGELRRTGHAEVDVATETEENSYTYHRETIRLDQKVLVDTIADRTLDELAYTCTDPPPPREAPIPDDAQCELLTRRDDPFLLRKERKFIGVRQVGGVAVAVLAASAFVGGIACAAACDSPYQEISIGALAGLVILAFASCAHSRTCHD